MTVNPAIVVLLSLGLFSLPGQSAEKEPEAAPDPEYPIVDAQPHTRPVCFYLGTLVPGQYRYATLRRISAAKKTYGAAEALYPGMADTARRAGADMVLDIKITTRHSSVVTRMATPVADGMAIKFAADSPKPDCNELGGRFY